MRFSESVFESLRQVPKGRVTTYKEVARSIGRPHAYRAVGQVLKTNKDPAIPCHRVIRSDGGLGGYNKGVGKKAQKLVSEGIEVKNGKIDKKYFFSIRTSKG